MKACPIGIVGFGKIARDQHAPTLRAHPGFRLAGVADPHAQRAEGPVHRDLAALLAAQPEIGALAICTPPQARFEAAFAALEAGRHVLLEKPPAATVSEAMTLRDLAAARGLTLFAAWHSRFAAGASPARRWLEGREVVRVRIDWKEDVALWHPGQDWIWAPGGLGVFDPGVNALSLLTEILPRPISVAHAILHRRTPAEAPVAADLLLRLEGRPCIEAAFDWRSPKEQWSVYVETEDGALSLTAGGAHMAIDGQPLALDPVLEYRALYDRFAALIARGEREVDLAPLILTSDAFLRGQAGPAG